MREKRAVVLLSGGLDSATTLAIARNDGFQICALTFRYGQRHAIEVEAAQRIAQHAGVGDHVIIDIDLRSFGGSALTSAIDVPRDRSLDEMANGIPVTYVPARNTIFFSYALALAEVRQTFDVFAGMNALDYAGYPDCRPEYIAAFEAMANLATKQVVESERSLKIHTPVIGLTKSEIIARGLELGVNYALTSSCYAPSDDGLACGRCDACRLRRQGFEELGAVDPVKYQTPQTGQ
jgi:7-cyano-7-deazaguanine synthase